MLEARACFRISASTSTNGRRLDIIKFKGVCARYLSGKIKVTRNSSLLSSSTFLPKELLRGDAGRRRQLIRKRFLPLRGNTSLFPTFVSLSPGRVHQPKRKSSISEF